MINLNVAATYNKVFVLRIVHLYAYMGTESFELHSDIIIAWNCVAVNTEHAVFHKCQSMKKQLSVRLSFTCRKEQTAAL